MNSQKDFTFSSCVSYSNVPLPFNWKIMKPCMRSCKNDKNRQLATEKHSVFGIKPSSGVFLPDACFQFEVTSSPNEVRSS